MNRPGKWDLAPLATELGGEETCEALEDLDEASRERVEEMATELLWGWTGRKYGLIETTVRPCRESARPHPYSFLGTRGTGWSPALVGGEWLNLYCGACPGEKCTCADDSAYHLRLPGPVYGIDEIHVDGEVLPSSAYRLAHGVLVRVDGEPWPMCNDDTAPVDEPGTAAWEITYQRGYEVPEGGRIAGYLLACELGKALAQDQECRLPQRVQSVTREGVTMSILDGFEGLDDGKTGIWEIDAWIASVNVPRPSPSRVYSPDVAAQRGTARATAMGIVGGRR